MTSKLRKVGVWFEQNVHTCSIHHFKGKKLNINIFVVSSNIFLFWDIFEGYYYKGKKSEANIKYLLLFSGTESNFTC